MNARFDVAFVTSNFSTCDLRHYLDVIRSMSNGELRALRHEVETHQKRSRPSRAFDNVPNLSTHAAVIKVINQELLRRTPMRKLQEWLFPVRKVLVEAFSGMELRLDDRFGVVYSVPKYRKTFLHTPHGEIVTSLWRFILRYEKQIATAVFAVAGAWVIKRFI